MLKACRGEWHCGKIEVPAGHKRDCGHVLSIHRCGEGGGTRNLNICIFMVMSVYGGNKRCSEATKTGSSGQKRRGISEWVASGTERSVCCSDWRHHSTHTHTHTHTHACESLLFLGGVYGEGNLYACMSECE